MGGHHAIHQGPEKNRMAEDGIQSLLELRHPSPLALGCWTFTPGFQAFELRSGIMPFAGLWTHTKLYSGFPGSLAYRWQMVGLLGFCNPVSQLQ